MRDSRVTKLINRLHIEAASFKAAELHARNDEVQHQMTDAEVYGQIAGMLERVLEAVQ